MSKDEFKEMERLRSKACHDEAQALYDAEVKAEKAKALSIAKRLLKHTRDHSAVVL